MLENLIIYACIAFALYVVIPRDKKQEAMNQIKSNYAEYKLELLLGGSNATA